MGLPADKGEGPRLAIGWTSAEEKDCAWLNPWQLFGCHFASMEGTKKLSSLETQGAKRFRAVVSQIQHPRTPWEAF